MVTLLQPDLSPIGEHPLATIGILADTHIPDRIRELPVEILEVFRSRRVDAIFHAGDISTPAVLKDLQRIAPVTAVLGNRDWLLNKDVPLHATIQLASLEIALTHGHGGWFHYLIDKAEYLAVGYRLERYRRFLVKLFPAADVIIFGHTHYPVSLCEGGQLIFNPGSACCTVRNHHGPSIGIMTIYPGKQICAEIIPLSSK